MSSVWSGILEIKKFKLRGEKCKEKEGECNKNAGFLSPGMSLFSLDNLLLLPHSYVGKKRLGYKL